MSQARLPGCVYVVESDTHKRFHLSKSSIQSSNRPKSSGHDVLLTEYKKETKPKLREERTLYDRGGHRILTPEDDHEKRHTLHYHDRSSADAQPTENKRSLLLKLENKLQEDQWLNCRVSVEHYLTTTETEHVYHSRLGPNVFLVDPRNPMDTLKLAKLGRQTVEAELQDLGAVLRKLHSLGFRHNCVQRGVFYCPDNNRLIIGNWRKISQHKPDGREHDFRDLATLDWELITAVASRIRGSALPIEEQSSSDFDKDISRS